MSLFSRAVNAIKNLFGLNKSIQDAFGITIAISPLMQAKQAEWRGIVAGAAQWNNADTPSLRLAGAVSQEIASRAALGLKCEITGSARADYLNEQFIPVVDDLQNAAVAIANCGEAIYKPHLSENGIEVTLVETDSYWTVSYNAKNELIDVIFGAVHQTDKYTYRLLERHTFNAEAQTHTIVYRAFKQEQSANNFTPESLGEPANLADVPDWANLQDITIQGIEQPLFVPVKAPPNEAFEKPQRQGVPVWTKATDQFKKADEMEAWTNWEVSKSKLRIQAPSAHFRRGEDGKLIFPDGADGLILPFDGAEVTLAPQTFNPELRMESAQKRMNDILRRIEFLCGLSYGIISNNDLVDKTATEFRASKERLIVTIDGIRAILETALQHLTKSFEVLADLQGIPQGAYEQTFEWSEDYKIDRETEAAERLKWQAAGVIPVQQNIAWWNDVDIDSETVKKIMQMVREERSETMDEFGG